VNECVAVDEARLTEMVRRLGGIGRLPAGGGIERPMYSNAWREAQDCVGQFMRDARLEVREDAVGNVFGRLPGIEDSNCVLTGSHIDTVTHGGAYDGALGILSGIAALEALARSAGSPRSTVEVVSLCEEEGSRFHANFFGTRSILGMVDQHEAERLVDVDGITLAEAARSVGLDPNCFDEARREDLAAFVELHIEQSRKLQDLGVDVGVVDVISGLIGLEITVEGSPDHAGATAMVNRRDALQGAARLAIAVDEVAIAQGAPAVATIGVMRVEPGGVNIVPGRVLFTVDMRHPDSTVLGRMTDAIRQRCAAVAAQRELTVGIEIVEDIPPHSLDPTLRAVLRDAAKKCDASWTDLPSGAAHDSQTMGTRVPAAMVFVPSVDGRSHSPAEYSRPEDCARGASVLATALHAIAW
jgi:allantoate deiminase